MSLDRLTERAREVLVAVQATVTKTSSVKSRNQSKATIDSDYIIASTIFDTLQKSDGVGGRIISTLPAISYTKTKKISMERLVKEAFFQSLKFQHTYVGTEHLLMALLKICKSKDAEKVRQAALQLSTFPASGRTVEAESSTPLLAMYGENSTYQSYLSREEYVYRDELNAIVAVLLQKQNPNPLIVGEAGVGKDALIGLLIRRINSLDVPPKVLGYQVISLDLIQFIAGVFNKGINLDQSISALLDEIRGLGRVILHIKNFQNIFIPTNSGVAVPLIYSLFKAGLARSDIKIIATMDFAIYDKLNTENASLISNFTVIDLNEPTEKQTLRVMQSRAKQLEDYHNIKIPQLVIAYAYKKAKVLESDTKFPQRGIDLLDKACSKLILKESKVPERYKDLIDDTILLAGKIDSSIEKGDYTSALKHRHSLEKVEHKLSTDEKTMFLSNKLVLTEQIVDVAVADEELSHSTPLPLDDLKTLQDRMKKRIVGQDKAIEVVVKSLIRSKLGLNSKKRPVGSFLFLGPTGVGKTELAKVLAEEAFGAGSLIRLDMADFGEKHTVARLVGAPPGYVGYGETGELTRKIDLKPQSVVLFDEIEKAHPEVLNILLQIMEEGQLVDAVGTAFNFNEAVVVLTSNLGTEILHRKDIGFKSELVSEDSVESRLQQNLKKSLKPELINRFDEIIVFRRLSRPSQAKIVNILVNDFKEGLKAKRIILTVDSSVKDHLLDTGFSQEFGARALRRKVEKELIDRVAEFLLDANYDEKQNLKLEAFVTDGKINIRSK